MSLDNNTSPLDELTLHRLVDGELTHEQVRQLLAEVEFGDEPSNWKSIALAFIENQLFERVLCQEESADAEVDLFPVDQSPGVVDRQELPRVEETSYRNSWWAPILAASLLLAMAGAYQISNFSHQVDSEEIAQSDLTKDGPKVLVEPKFKSIESFDRVTLASYEPDHQLEVKDIGSVSVGHHNSSIPLYNVGRFSAQQQANLRSGDRAARAAMFSRVLPQSLSPQLMQQLKQSGGMVDQNLDFITGQLNDGRPYLIPYRTIRFLPSQ